jgi:CBS domain containing-hemolysin-like protein
VTNGDIDHIVGILRLQDVTTLDTARKHTSLVETAMRPQIQYIAQDRPLQEALDTLLRSQEHILIVVDEASQVVGLLTMSDIMRTLFGK